MLPDFEPRAMRRHAWAMAARRPRRASSRSRRAQGTRASGVQAVMSPDRRGRAAPRHRHFAAMAASPKRAQGKFAAPLLRNMSGSKSRAMRLLPSGKGLMCSNIQCARICGTSSGASRSNPSVKVASLQRCGDRVGARVVQEAAGGIVVEGVFGRSFRPSTGDPSPPQRAAGLRAAPPTDRPWRVRWRGCRRRRRPPRPRRRRARRALRCDTPSAR